MRRIRRQTWLLTLTIVATAALGAMLAVAAGAEEEWKAPADAAAKKNPVAVDDDSLATGKESYDGQCADCHGATGKGDGKKADDMKPEEKKRMKPLTDPSIVKQSDGELFWKIAEGKKPMPAGKKLMDDDEMWSVVIYMRTLQK